MTFLYVLYRFYQLPETTLDFFYPAAILRRGMFFRRLRTPAEPEESPTAAESSEKLENFLDQCYGIENMRNSDMSAEKHTWTSIRYEKFTFSESGRAVEA